MKSVSKGALAAVILASAFSLLPVLLLALTSFKPEAEVLGLEGIFPREWTLENFRRIFGTPEETPIALWFFSSVFIATATTFLVLATSSLSAFALVRLKPRGSGVMLAVIVGTMMVPAQILLVPVYQLLNALGWIDTPAALIFPAAATGFGVFLLSQFFRDLPVDLEEAARIDGCGHARVFWHVILPLSRSPLATLAIFTFVGSWNNFIAPLVFLDSLHRYTLPVGIALFQSSYATEFGITFAACLLSSIPLLVAFLFFQRHIIRSVALTGLK